MSLIIYNKNRPSQVCTSRSDRENVFTSVIHWPIPCPTAAGGAGWELGGVSQVLGGLQLTEAYRRLQLVGQGGEDFVELLVALGLAAFSPTAAPEQPQLELGAEYLQQLRSALETCREGQSVPWDGMGWDGDPAPVGCSIWCWAAAAHRERGRGKGALPSPLLTLQLHLGVGVVKPAVVGHHPRRLQVGHDHLHAVVGGVPGLRAVRESLIPLQESHKGHDVGKGGVGQRRPFCGERHPEDPAQPCAPASPFPSAQAPWSARVATWPRKAGLPPCSQERL